MRRSILAIALSTLAYFAGSAGAAPEKPPADESRVINISTHAGAFAQRVTLGMNKAAIVQLTKTGKDMFRTMATAHERWIADLLAGVTKSEARQLTSMLKAFRSNWEGRE